MLACVDVPPVGFSARLAMEPIVFIASMTLGSSTSWIFMRLLDPTSPLFGKFGSLVAMATLKASSVL